MENFNLNRFYKDVLSNINFSITGYPDVITKIDKFLNDIIYRSSFYERPHIKFLSYTYSEITNIDNFETKPIDSKKFFFNAFKEYSTEEIVLNTYYLFKKYLNDLHGFSESTEEKKEGRVGKSGAVIVSELFGNPVSFGVCSTEDNYLSVHYNQHEDIIYVKVPINKIYQLKENEIAKSLRSKFFKIFEENIEAVISLGLAIEKQDNFYTIDKTKFGEEIIDDKIKNLLNESGIKEIVKLLVNKLTLLDHTSKGYFFRNFRFEEENEKENLIKQLALFIIAHSFLGFLLNIDIENIQSVVYDRGENDKRSIGLLIVGYSPEKRINSDERAMLKLIAERISYVVSAQTVFENNRKLKREFRREQMKNALDAFNNFYKNNDNTDITHGIEAVTDDFNFNFYTYFNKYNEFLTDEFKYCYEKIKKNRIINKGELEIKNTISKSLLMKIEKYQHDYDRDYMKYFLDYNCSYFNISLIKNLIDAFAYHKNDNKKCCIDTSCIEIVNNKLCYIINYNPNRFDINNFVNSLKNNLDSDVVGKFFCKYYYNIDCHGIVSLYYFDVEGKEIEFFNSRKSIEKINEGKIVVNLKYPFPSESLENKVEKIKLIFENELI